MLQLVCEIILALCLVFLIYLLFGKLLFAEKFSFGRRKKESRIYKKTDRSDLSGKDKKS